MRWLFTVLRLCRDARALSRGRLGPRLWNRAVSAGWRKARRKLYK